MFVRRHPILFSFLVFTAIVGAVIVSVTALFVLGRKDSGLQFDGEKVGIIEITGVIVDAKPTIEHLKKFRKNEDIKAIVLRIDSPGGGVGASQEIHSEIRKTILEKKVIASMGTIAASGGYYVAAATDHIVANPGTITGSIGVIMEFVNVEALLERIGFDAEVIKSGEYKDVGSPMRKMTPEERKLLKNFVDNVHQQFVTAVVEGREMTEEAVRAIADGRILSGDQAQKLGLLDTLGNIEDAIGVAAELGGIVGEPAVVYAEKKRFSVIEFLLGSRLAGTLDRMMGGSMHPAYLYVPGQLYNG